MNKICLACMFTMLCAGCAVYHIPTPCGEATIKTFCKTVVIPRISATASNATIVVEGYASKGDTEIITASAGAIGAIAGAAAKAAAK